MYHSESKEKPGRLQRLASSRALDRGVLLAIIVNSVLLALTAAMDNEPKYDTWQGGLELALFVLFLLEFLVKVAAWGRAYFYDPWNLIDAAVVAEGVYTHPVTILLKVLDPGVAKNKANVSLSALRIMRLLRPLRTLKRFPEMRLLVESLLNSGQLLLVGFAVVAAAIYAFAVCGHVYFADALNRRCVAYPIYDGSDYVRDPNDAALAAHWPVCKSNLQPDFNVRVFEYFDTSTSAVLRELAESSRFVQKSAESTSI